MRDTDKTKNQLVDELVAIRQHVSELEAAQTAIGRADQALQDKLELQRTISRISSRFIGVSDTDDAINASLADIGSLSGASRSYMFLIREDGATMDNTHEWCTKSVNPEMDNLQNLPCDMFPWWMKRLRKGEVIHVKDVSRLPQAASGERRILESQDIKSVLVLPLNVGESLAGFVGFDNVVEAAEWSDDDLMLLRVVSETIGNALERELAEEALRESEENFRALADNSHDGITVIAGEGAHVYANRQAAAITGYSVSELLQNTFKDLVHPDYLDELAERYERRLEGKPVPDQYEAVIVRKDGRSVPIEVSATGTVWRGKPAAMVMYRDITERRRMEDELRRSEEQLRLTFQSVSDGVAVADLEGAIIDINDIGVKMYGAATEDEVLGMSAFDLIAPRDRAKAMSDGRRVLEQGAVTNLEYTLVRADGSEYPGELSVRVMKDVLGNPVGFVAIVRDITERKRMEEVLRSSEERYRGVVENARDIIYTVSPDGHTTSLNPAFEAITGWSCSDWIGKPFAPIVHPDDLPRTTEAFRDAARERTGQLVEARILSKSGEYLPMEFTGTPLLVDGELIGFQGIGRDVTERRRMEEALRQSEEHFRSLIENSQDAIAILDSNGTITYVSPSYERILGFKPEERIGKNTLERIHPDDVLRLSEAYVQFLQEPGRTLQAELRLRHKDGSWRAVELLGRSVLDDPTVGGIIVNFRDITERQQMEKALRQSEEYFRSLIENSQDGITILRGDGTVSYVSPSCERILGFKPEELTGVDPLGWGHPDDLSKLSGAFARFLQEQGSTARAEVRVQHKDGSWRWIEVVASNLLHDPTVESIVVNWRDFTERIDAEDALRHSEEYFRALIENSLDAVAILSIDGTLAYQSPSFQRVLGYEPGETIGQDPLGFVDPDDMTRMSELLAQMIRDHGGTMRDEARVRHKDGSWRTIEVVASNLLDVPSVTGIVANFRDVTDRKQMEERLTKLYEREKQLRQQLEEEMNRRVEFSRILAHELKTPLTSVIASSDSLLDTVQEEPLLSLARNIGRGASNLNSRIDELLDLARGEVGVLELKLESVDLLQLVREAAQTMAPVAASHGQSLALELPPTLPWVRADADRVQQVVLNLLSNAIKFTPNEGKIKLRAREKGAALIVEVQDTGPGIASDEQQRLFEPYHRLESDRGRLSGLGLGLALCKTLVELHGGQIWVKSRAGRGATFGFSLPLEATGQQPEEPRQANKLWKILIVEDDQEIIDSISLVFRMDWPEAQLVSTRLGEDGVDLVETEAPDIVILDLGLPDMDGFDVLSQIRLFSAVPIIILTVKAEEADITRGLECGADDYLIKPFRQKELLARLKVQLRRQTPPDEEAPIICGSLRLYPSTFQLEYGSREISLTIIEGRIMQHLMRNAGHVSTHARLAEAVWGEDYPGALDSLRVYIRYLREKLEADPSNPKMILTKSGVGYSLARPL